MIKFEFELDTYESLEGFELGDLTITGENANITSKGQSPDQSMMVFLAITDLLEGVRDLVSDDSVSEFEFVGADSSFSFLLEKNGQGIAIVQKQSPVANATDRELTQAIHEGVTRFLKLAGFPNLSDEAVRTGLDYALKKFSALPQLRGSV